MEGIRSRVMRHILLFSVFLVLCILAYNDCEARGYRGKGKGYGLQRHHGISRIYNRGRLHKGYRKHGVLSTYGRPRYHYKKKRSIRIRLFRRRRKHHVHHHHHHYHPVARPTQHVTSVHVHVHGAGCKRPCGVLAHCVHGVCVCDPRCHGNPYVACSH